MPSQAPTDLPAFSSAVAAAPVASEVESTEERNGQFSGPLHDEQPLIHKRPLWREQEQHLTRRSFILQLVCILFTIASTLAACSLYHSLLTDRSLSDCQPPLRAASTSSSSAAGPLLGLSNTSAEWVTSAVGGDDTADAAVASFALAAAGALLPLPGTAVVNFTVEAALPPDRWPATIDRQMHYDSSAGPTVTDHTTDPFIAGSPTRFHSTVRGAIISLYTPNQHDHLVHRFKVNDELFYGPHSSHSDVIIFYTVYPDNADWQLHVDLTSLGCRELTNTSSLTSRHPDISDIYARLRHPTIDFSLEMASIREFITPHAAHIITVPIAANLPQHLNRDPGRLQRPGWMSCFGQSWSMGYILFSGAVFSSKIVLHPILRGYDYFIKMDLDIRFLQPAPAPSLFHSMHNQSCVWMHSHYSTRQEDCGLDAGEAVEAWAAEHNTSPASHNTTWWKSLDYFYGNFVGGWLGWVRSVENRQLATYLYENERHPGYFQHRWTDQPPFAKMLGMWFSVADKDVRGQPRPTAEQQTHSQVCDFSALREGVILHKN